jgi:RNA polymerase sigma-70 factor (ECF subfamily)
VDIQKISDDELLVAYQDGDEFAFNEIYSRYAKEVSMVVKMQIRGTARNDIEDIVQQVFLEFHKRRNDFGAENNVKAWLKIVAYNRAVDYIRHKTATKRGGGRYEDPVIIEQLTECASDDLGPEDEAINNETFSQYEAWLESKPKKWQDILKTGHTEAIRKIKSLSKGLLCVSGKS